MGPQSQSAAKIGMRGEGRRTKAAASCDGCRVTKLRCVRQPDGSCERCVKASITCTTAPRPNRPLNSKSSARRSITLDTGPSVLRGWSGNVGSPDGIARLSDFQWGSKRRKLVDFEDEVSPMGIPNVQKAPFSRTQTTNSAPYKVAKPLIPLERDVQELRSPSPDLPDCPVAINIQCPSPNTPEERDSGRIELETSSDISERSVCGDESRKHELDEKQHDANPLEESLKKCTKGTTIEEPVNGVKDRGDDSDYESRRNETDQLQSP